ncbi:MAG TPA: DUF72 domain-containing protein [Pyrinomonadaceae bacterium]|jgi:uncharacterized protein YecE (DUF72 family)
MNEQPTKLTSKVEIGCQGWNYEDWVTMPASESGIFYPRGTRASAMLETYARVFRTVEVDSTFYAVPSASTVEGWARRTPSDFTFSLKLPQIITHQLALRRGSEDVLAHFCHEARKLGAKLASILIQLPPQFEATPENSRALREFLPLLPRDIRFAIELRDPFWFEETTLDLLSPYPHVCLALVEAPWLRRETLFHLAQRMHDPFAYIRWMGARDLTRFDILQRPQDENLRSWSDLIRQLSARTPDIYAYFSNFYEGHAPASANKLKRLLGQPIVSPDELESQPSLF